MDTSKTNKFLREGSGILLAAVVLLLSGCGNSASALPTEEPPELSFQAGAHTDFGPKMADCLKVDGWDASVGDGGSVKIDNIPDGQLEAATAAKKECSDKLGFSDDPPALDEAQVREAYAHYLWGVKCLEDAGYEPAQPPSEQAFVDSYFELGGLKSPYDLSGVTDDADLRAMWNACPDPYAQ